MEKYYNYFQVKSVFFLHHLIDLINYFSFLQEQIIFLCQVEILEIEEKFGKIFSYNLAGIFSKRKWVELRALEEHKYRLLVIEETTWRLKIRAI